MGWLVQKNAVVNADRIDFARRRTAAAEAGFGRNRRRSLRIAASGNGQIVMPRGNRVQVSLVDISETGARIKLSCSNRLPIKFHLVLPKQGIDATVMLAWQSSFEAGIYFS